VDVFPDTPVAEEVQVNDVPATVLCKPIEVVAPLHIVDVLPTTMEPTGIALNWI
jgi:hypothetical protein